MSSLIESLKDDNTYESDNTEGLVKIFEGVIELLLCVYIIHTFSTTTPSHNQSHNSQDAKKNNLYRRSHRTRALKVILLVVSTGKTSVLAECLLKENQIEARGILNEVMLCMHPNWTGLVVPFPPEVPYLFTQRPPPPQLER